MKLTKTRYAMLAQVGRSPGSYSAANAPLKALRDAGLVRKVMKRHGDRFEITETGKLVLKNNRNLR